MNIEEKLFGGVWMRVRDAVDIALREVVLKIEKLRSLLVGEE